MEPPERVPWADLLAEYRQRNHKSGYKLEDPKRGLLHALCNQMGVVFNSTAAFLNDVQREQLLCKLVPEYVVEDPSMIFWFHCVGHHRRRDEIIMDACRLKTENEEDFYRTSPYNRLLCVFHVKQACHINLGHLMLRLMADLGEEFIDTQKWAEWLASTNLTADTYFFLSEDEYGHIRDYVRREPSLPVPPPSVDAPAPPDIDPPGDSPEPSVQDPPETAEPPPEEPATNPGSSTDDSANSPERRPVVTDWHAEATGGGPSRAADIKSLGEYFLSVVEGAQRRLPGVPVLVLVDNKVVTGDIEAPIRALYHHLAGDNGVALAEDKAELFVNLCVVAFGDTEAIRKAAKSVFDKKGA